jgi:hypothetical protein
MILINRYIDMFFASMLSGSLVSTAGYVWRGSLQIWLVVAVADIWAKSSKKNTTI